MSGAHNLIKVGTAKNKLSLRLGKRMKVVSLVQLPINDQELV